MRFSQERFELFQSDPTQAILDLCNEVVEHIGDDMDVEWAEDDHEYLIESCALLSSVFESNLAHTGSVLPPLVGEIGPDCSLMNRYVRELRGQFQQLVSNNIFLQHRQRFSAALRGTFAYEFSQEDVTRLQELVNELRSHITGAAYFEEDYRRRLLNRLERLQSEVHKRVSDLDRFWGMIGDAGVAIGKFGENAKPMVDRIKEMADIIWRAQTNAEALPSDTPLALLTKNSSE